ncbi:MAG: alternative ribosome-rescue factor [Phenylobacterium sp.]|jgi:alternative ribosome-rescue factor
MSKSNKKSNKALISDSEQSNNVPTPMPIEIGRGKIKDNFLAAIVTSRVYRQQVVQAKKGKGSFQRKEKHKDKGRESWLIAA